MYDVAIIGGGPAGSTLGALLKKYRPQIDVLILESEIFPREHVGESQLPPISGILDEMGCWDKVEAANFPIKIGATYRWGTCDKLWDLDFMGVEFQDEARPAKFEGQRRHTAFQVDRAVYDKILLDHAKELGCVVREDCRVSDIMHENDSVQGLILADDEVVHAKHYVDASGTSAILRRKLNVPVENPASLKNIAIWDYWENAEWAETLGIGGTRVQILSLGYGWIWFIPLSPTKTSIGLITSVDYYKECDMSKEALYQKALSDEKRVQRLITNASREGVIRATKDWSFISERLYGDNWFLVGESAGFADPILAAGLTLAQVAAQMLAYTIIGIEDTFSDKDWLRSHYEKTQKLFLDEHIAFANYWYTANGQFTDLQDYTAQIAADSGFKMSPQEAFQWLGTGGFSKDFSMYVSIGTYELILVKYMEKYLSGIECHWDVVQYNMFKINLEGAKLTHIPQFLEGNIYRRECYERDNIKLPNVGIFAIFVSQLRDERHFSEVFQCAYDYFASFHADLSQGEISSQVMQVFESLYVEGWLDYRFEPSKPEFSVEFNNEYSNFRTRDTKD